jgi:hypothetical protein
MFLIALAALAAPAVARAEGRGIGVPPPAAAAEQMLARAQAKIQEGEASFARGDFDHARTSFDDAIDIFITSGYDLRSDPRLMAAYREAVERVNRYQAIGVDAEGDSVWPMQEYEATVDDFRVPEMPDPADVVAAGGDLLRAGFITRVSELQRRFKEKFGRTFTLTGRDTGVHARLYGAGRAADVRVSDLTQPQVRFLIDNARALNMRALDFSTYDRVMQHNMRVMSLGRPSDTLATGIHIHLNDQPLAAPRYAEQPAAKRKFAPGQ